MKFFVLPSKLDKSNEWHLNKIGFSASFEEFEMSIPNQWQASLLKMQFSFPPLIEQVHETKQTVEQNSLQNQDSAFDAVNFCEQFSGAN